VALGVVGSNPIAHPWQKIEGKDLGITKAFDFAYAFLSGPIV
jgi:hypothetical protein